MEWIGKNFLGSGSRDGTQLAVLRKDLAMEGSEGKKEYAEAIGRYTDGRSFPGPLLLGPVGEDPRYCYGACCTWHGSIKEVGVQESGLPCCPFCNGVLFEHEKDQDWWTQVDTFKAGVPSLRRSPHPGYRKMLEWQHEQKRCFPDFLELVQAYYAATGIAVDIS